MKLLFARSHLPGSYLIRWLTFSKWSHVAVCFGDGTAIEATWPKVRSTTTQKIIDSHSAHEFRTLPVIVDVQWFRNQVGKPYDLSALLMYLNPWRNDGLTNNDKWFCSELIAAGAGMFADNERVSPQMLYLLSKEV